MLSSIYAHLPGFLETAKNCFRNTTFKQTFFAIFQAIRMDPRQSYRIFPPKRFLVVFGAVLTGSLTASTTLHVSPQGTPSGTGSSGAPLSLRSALEQAAADSSIGTVVLHDGIYRLSASLRLTGVIRTDEHPLRLVAAEGASPEISGSVSLAGNWKRLTPHDELYDRLPDEAREAVWLASLPAAGIHDYGERVPHGFVRRRVAPGELYVGRDRQVVAGWPNAGQDERDADPAIEAGFVTYAEASGLSVRFPREKLRQWQSATDLWAHGYWGSDWADSALPVESLDATEGWLTVGDYPPHGVSKNGAIRVYNLPEELDQPGEWYLDRATGNLYFWPSRPNALEQTEFTMTRDPLLVVEHSRNLWVEGIAFTHSRAELVKLVGAEAITFDQCQFHGSGLAGLSIEGNRNHVIDCLFENLGESAVTLSGGDLATLRPAANLVSQCVLRRYGQRYLAYSTGVRLQGVGQTVAHNLIEQAPHEGVQINGALHHLWRNEIRDVCQFTDDAGAIYSGRDWTGWGNLIEENYIHSIHTRRGDRKWVHGLYLDDCASGFAVRGNIFEDIDAYATDLGGGRNNVIEENLMRDLYGAHLNDNRGSKWITNTPGGSWNMLDGIAAVDSSNDPWRTVFPALAATPTTWESSAPARLPQNCVFARNAGQNFTKWAVEVDWTGNGVFAHYDTIEKTPVPLGALPEAQSLAALSPRRDLTITGVNRTIPFPAMGLTSSTWTAATATDSASPLLLTWENERGIYAGQTAFLRADQTRSSANDELPLRWTIDASDYTGFPRLEAQFPGPGLYPIRVETKDGQTGLLASATRWLRVFPESARPHPFNGSPQSIPGVIEAEAFDEGAFHDNSAKNKGGQFRDTAVDLAARDGATYVGWTQSGEWLEYTIEAEPGAYEVIARAASRRDDAGLRLEWNGRLVAARILPNVHNNLSFEETSLGQFTITENGRQTLRVEMIGKDFNFDFLRFEKIAEANPTETDGGTRIAENSGSAEEPTPPLDTPEAETDPTLHGLTAAWYDGIAGTDYEALLAASKFPGVPDRTATVESFAITSEGADNFGLRVSGWLVPSATGPYRFWIAGDDRGFLRLSPSAEASEATTIATLPRNTKPRRWDKFPEQASAEVELVAGHAYYIEAVLKDGWSNDHLDVAWAGPGINRESIPSANLRPNPPADADNPPEGNTDALGKFRAMTMRDGQVALVWNASRATTWQVETSTDLVHWRPVAAGQTWSDPDKLETVVENLSGYFRLVPMR